MLVKKWNRNVGLVSVGEKSTCTYKIRSMYWFSSHPQFAYPLYHNWLQLWWRYFLIDSWSTPFGSDAARPPFIQNPSCHVLCVCWWWCSDNCFTIRFVDILVGRHITEACSDRSTQPLRSLFGYTDFWGIWYLKGRSTTYLHANWMLCVPFYCLLLKCVVAGM